ncbi:MAG: DUF962 domain-containing protein [Terriglobia bacterium]
MSVTPIPRIATFEKFWPFYVGEHSRAMTRWLHFAGTLGGTLGLLILIVTRHARYFPFILIYSYGLAWIGHFFVEKNRPATFKYPLWSFLSDYKMCAFMLTGKMEAELRKIFSPEKPA